MSRKSFEVAAIIGCGIQEYMQLEAVCAVRHLKRNYSFDVNSRRAEEIVREMSEKLVIPIVVADCQDFAAASHLSQKAADNNSCV